MRSAMLTDGTPVGAGERNADGGWEELGGAQDGVRRGTLVVSRGVSRLSLSFDPQQEPLVRARFEGFRPDVRVTDGVVRLRSPFAPLAWIRELLHGHGGGEATELVLRGGIPWDLRLRGGLSGLEADLSRGEISTVRVDGGVSSARLVLPAPRGTVTLRFDGGVNHVELVRPAGSPVRVRVDGGISSIELDGRQRARVGEHVRIASPGWREAEHRYDVRLSGGVSHAVVAPA